MTCKYENLPADLREHGLFCVWKYQRKANGDLTKVPYNPNNPRRKADSTNRTHFAPLETALKHSVNFDGIGTGVFDNLFERGNLVGVDIDHCIDENGNLSAEAAEIIGILKYCYWEKSPSGHGLRGFGLTSKDFQYNTSQYYIKKGGLEIYAAGATSRFLTLTGNVVRPAERLEDVTHELLEVMQKYMRRSAEKTNTNNQPGAAVLPDDDVVRRVSNAANGEKFMRLWSGDISGYDSSSNADLALCEILAFWCNRDPEQIERLFRQSALMRPKWDSRRGSSTYGRMTVEQAIRECKNVWKPPADTLMPKQWSDVDQAKVFIQEYGHMVKFSKATNWIVYDGSRWVENELDARKLSQELTDRQLSEARKMLSAARKKSDDAVEAGDPEETGATKKEIRKAEKCRSEVLKRRKSSSITATLAEAAPGCQIDVMELDADPYLLNTPGGTVDLRTGKIRPHDPEDYCTKITAVSPDDKNADVWETFIDQITLGDKDLARYLQEIVGLSIIGTVKREELLIATGGGNNGKSTCFNTIHKVLGDYAGMLSAETLTVKSRKNKSPEYAELRGKRFIIAAELEEGQLLDTATVKKLCSTDPIIAEKKFKDPFVFTPSHHVLLYTNHLPRVGSTDKGTWRRLVTIPFLAAFEEGKGQIKDYETYLFNHCAGAVLSWLIRGAQRALIQDFIIEIPQCVKDAIQEYKEASDWLSNFISEWCAVGPGRYATGRELHERYKEYCDHTGEFKRSPSAFSQALEAAGFKKKPTKRGNVYYGISILDYQQRQMEIQADKSDGIAQWKKDFAVRVEDG